MDAKQVRVFNLTRLIREKAEGSQAEFGRRFDMSAAHISQLLSRHRDIGDKLAREIEGKLGLERGELDRLPGNSTAITDPLMAHLIDLYKSLSEDGRDKLIGVANRIYVEENPGPSKGNPFPGVPIPKPEPAKSRRRGK